MWFVCICDSGNACHFTNSNASGSFIRRTRHRETRQSKTKQNKRSKQNCFVELNRTCYVLRIKCQNNEMKNGHTMAECNEQLSWEFFPWILWKFVSLTVRQKYFCSSFTPIFHFARDVVHPASQSAIGNAWRKHLLSGWIHILINLHSSFLHFMLHTLYYNNTNKHNTTAKFAMRPENVQLNKFMKLLFWPEFFPFRWVITLFIHEQTNLVRCACGMPSICRSKRFCLRKILPFALSRSPFA